MENGSSSRTTILSILSNSRGFDLRTRKVKLSDPTLIVHLWADVRRNLGPRNAAWNQIPINGRRAIRTQTLKFGILNVLINFVEWKTMLKLISHFLQNQVIQELFGYDVPQVILLSIMILVAFSTSHIVTLGI